MDSPSLLPQEYIEELRESFSCFDKDKDGCITSHELRTVMAALRIESSEQEITNMIQSVDVDGNGTVDFHEFLRMMSQSGAYRRRQNAEEEEKGATGRRGRRSGAEEEEREMRQAFRIFDIDSNGFIDAKELKITMCNLGEDVSDRDVKRMMKLADKNGDGKIDYEEFIQMMFNK